MGKREKVYCGECEHYSAGKKIRGDQCLVAEIITMPNTESYKHRACKRPKYCWEKNEKNNCRDYVPKEKL